MTFQDLFKAHVRIERDIGYDPRSDHPRHTLDVYSPVGGGPYPVVIYLYGGGWRSGDKRLFEHLGRAFVVRGITAVTVNYRLTPEVSHPGHAEDAAAAVAWVVKNIASRGGDPGKVFLMGHSAGAHLAALLAIDDSYLSAAGVPADAVRGAAVVSGVYDLRSHAESPGFTSREMIHEAFGSTQSELGEASPVFHLRPDLPPFLVLVAEDDPERMREQGKDFSTALRELGTDVWFASIKERDHFSIVRRFGPSADPTAGAVADFIHHVAGGSSGGTDSAS